MGSWEAAGWIWTLHSKGNRHRASKRQDHCPGEPWGPWQLNHGRVVSVGSLWEFVLPLRSSVEGLHSPAPLCCHFFSYTFWPADKGHACVHQFSIAVTKCLELGRGKIYFGLWFLGFHEARPLWACGEAMSQGGGWSRAECIMVTKKWREREGREGQGKT